MKTSGSFQKGHKVNLGRHRSEETIAKIRQSKLGKSNGNCSEETKHKISLALIKHGDRKRNGTTRFYRVWKGMKGRCINNINYAKYKWYRGRGIKVCEEWSDYLNFKRDMEKSYESHIKEYGEKDTTLDRIDNKKGYSKENCRWATLVEQGRNKSTVCLFGGETQLQASFRLGGSKSLIFNRLRKGMSPEIAYNLPRK